ncbi:hypothetical protein MAPG_07705 [Magnaporthiopsis poae ATCC 64411]|uniref:Protein arginine methyltransferase NDUFAF7 n=1 Tax=Magnaporthiopsis poae (strain ATCC 64411 / 73-15) TaxID=644358 RepID=A0A0C4E5D9_MAGP6|nr:hypothetical protein MAPG_07705 [Magnaporthiopsis poae ATCC 64411]
MLLRGFRPNIAVMDSAILSQLFKKLFSHPACVRQPRLAAATTLASGNGHRPYTSHSRHRHHAVRAGPQTGTRGFASHRGPKSTARADAHWQQRTDIFTADRSGEFGNYPTVTAAELRGRRERPRRVKMLTRDFIEDSLYNPNYGYFSKQVVIFSPGEPFDFTRLRDENAFHKLLGQRYTDFEDRLDADKPSDTRQLWYTPTELFRPYYGEAIARYLMANYILASYPYHDLVIYEMGAGRGTLMLNILDFIRDTEPSVYDRTKYRIIEISSNLADLQSRQLLSTATSRGHADKVEIINQSIFDWNQPEPDPCFFLAFEVFDNFAHDCIRYDLTTEQPMQGTVLIDDQGDFYEFYAPHLDPLAARFFRVRHAATAGRHPVPYPANRLLRSLRANLPFAANLSSPEYIPTRLMQFFEVLDRYFPAHRLVTSDFHSLPDTTPGLNGPIVQTRYQRRPVPVSTPLVHQGYFDIMFPTDFGVTEAMYQAITGRLTRVSSHEDFMRRWAYIEETQTLSGENPLLSWFKNASVMTTL